MSTYLGACVNLNEADIDPAPIAAAEIVYLEGYLWDPPEAKKAFRKAMQIARAAGTRVALTLSDSFCVDRWRDEFRELVTNHVDILFANEAEIISLYETTGFGEAMREIGGRVEVAVLTRSEKGSVVVAGEEIHRIEAAPVAKVVDATGAGDLYAAGFLYGYARGLPLAEAGRVASICAAEIISHYGARPEADLKALVEETLAA